MIQVAPHRRYAVMLRPDLERYAAWERTAGGQAVSTWLSTTGVDVEGRRAVGQRGVYLLGGERRDDPLELIEDVHRAGPTSR